VTVNQFLPAAYVETAGRLAVGIIPASALNGAPPLPDVRLALERVPQPYPVPAGAGETGTYDVGIGLPTVARSSGGRFAISYSQPGPRSPVAVRLYDTERRYVPRRLRLPVPAEATAVAAEQAAERSPWPPIPSRAFRPMLFPGANGGTQAGVTAIRGRVVRADGSAARWARVAAADADHGYPAGWAHGDDRGEFLLILTSSDADLFTPGSALAHVALTISARPVPAAVDSPVQSQADPLWDLEVESLPSPGTADSVSDGRTPPADYSQSVTATLSVVKGAVSVPRPPFVLP
jgi:hypothetical protein